MGIRIQQHLPGANLAPFIQVGHTLFREDPVWVPPLHMELRDRLTPAKNPFFQHADATLFTAHQGDRLVGRCSAQVDYEHLRLHRDETGFFGFLDTIDSQEVVDALLRRAESWLRARGMKHVRGPYSLSINEEVGTLVEGFDTPPMILMPHSLPHQGKLIEQSGYPPVKDLLAWRYELGEMSSRVQRAWETVQAMPELRFRTIRKANMLGELRVIMDVFNDAWSENWGFVPITEAELEKTANDLKLIVDEQLAFVVEKDGRPVAICVGLPNINEAIHDLNGKLFPTGLAKLLWRTKVQRPKTARLMLLGIRKELRRVRRYAPLSVAVYGEMAKRGAARGYQWGELSWTLEDNHAINHAIQGMGGHVYKKYRVYEKAL